MDSGAPMHHRDNTAGPVGALCACGRIVFSTFPYDKHLCRRDGVSYVITDLPLATSLRSVGDVVRFFALAGFEYPSDNENAQNDRISSDYHSETISCYNTLAAGVPDEYGVLPGTDLASLQAYGPRLGYILVFAKRMTQDEDIFRKTWSYGRCQLCDYTLICFPRGKLQGLPHRCNAGGKRTVYNTVKIIRCLDDFPPYVAQRIWLTCRALKSPKFDIGDWAPTDESEWTRKVKYKSRGSKPAPIRIRDRKS
jgi:hypothetical protein